MGGKEGRTMRNVRHSHTSWCPVETLTQCTKNPSTNSINNGFLRFFQDCNAVVIKDERLDCWGIDCSSSSGLFQ